MRAYVECQINKKTIPYRPYHRAIDKTLKIQESAGHFCIWILPEYCLSAIPAYAYKMVTTTAYVLQIGNCFCNTCESLSISVVISWHAVVSHLGMFLKIK